MNLEILNKANDLKRKIEQLQAITFCFYYPEYDNEGNETGKLDFDHSRNPKIIIEFDDYEGGREELKLPLVPSEKFVKTIFDESAKELQKTIQEFESL